MAADKNNKIVNMYNYDNIGEGINLVLVGSCVGKTSMIVSYTTEDEFKHIIVPTGPPHFT